MLDEKGIDPRARALMTDAELAKYSASKKGRLWVAQVIGRLVARAGLPDQLQSHLLEVHQEAMSHAGTCTRGEEEWCVLVECLV